MAGVGDHSLDLETAHPTRALKWSLEKGKPVLELGLAWSDEYIIALTCGLDEVIAEIHNSGGAYGCPASDRMKPHSSVGWRQELSSNRCGSWKGGEVVFGAGPVISYAPFEAATLKTT